MEFIIQKSTEIGVNTITPIISEKCKIKIPYNKINKIQKRWKKIIISACEQCGRNKLPLIKQPITLKEWCSEKDNFFKINLYKKSSFNIHTIPLSIDKIKILVGPESGLSLNELSIIKKYKFKNISLGERTFRVEIASLIAIASIYTHLRCF